MGRGSGVFMGGGIGVSVAVGVAVGAFVAVAVAVAVAVEVEVGSGVCVGGTGVSVAVAAGGRVVLGAGIAGAGWEFTVGVAGAAGAVPPPQAESRSVRANSRLESACRRVFTMGPFSLSMSGLVLTIAYRTQYALNNQSISVQRGFRWRNASTAAPLSV